MAELAAHSMLGLEPYLERIPLSKRAATRSDWLRLFMVPGMGHCGGGEGPDQVNWLDALERWVEADKTPERITAGRVRNNRLEMTRPLCPHPAVAVYDGSGDSNDAASFSCEIR